MSNLKGKSSASAAERQERMAAALAADPGHKTWSWRGIQTILITLCVCCCSEDAGFDGAVMSGINAMNESGAQTGIVFGIYTIGGLIGSFPAANVHFSHIHWTRSPRAVKLSLDSSSSQECRLYAYANSNAPIYSVGAVLSATATHRGTFIGGRLLTGIGMGCANTSAKSYLAEIVPPQTRGFWVGLFNSLYYIGQMSATGMMVATGRWTGNQLAWRLPLYIQAVPAGINVLFVYLCPESPRWLYANGRKDEARAVLAKLHSGTNDHYSPVVEIEMEEIEEKTSLDGTDKRFWDIRSLIRTASDRYRTGSAVMVGIFGQLSGNGMVTYFLPVLLGQAGITSQDKKLTLTFMLRRVTSMVGALIGSAIIDRLGRRALLLGSTTMLICILGIIIGLLSSDGNSGQANAGIAFSRWWVLGLALVNILNKAVSCINTFGPRYSDSQVSESSRPLSNACVFYYQGLTLEQIDEVFLEPKPRQYSVEHAMTLKAKGEKFDSPMSCGNPHSRGGGDCRPGTNHEWGSWPGGPHYTGSWRSGVWVDYEYIMQESIPIVGTHSVKLGKRARWKGKAGVWKANMCTGTLKAPTVTSPSVKDHMRCLRTFNNS
ncbi:sugar [Rhizoctonia solani AG-1 IA]|uniref:Sugar n=1 Tax=Thanatephorus cucumeris (strain AG1-IA) TaxID=983506 RepID=L8WZS0_THACA|nr:sugar [Rhizoctonia solani AG-1 IA]